MEVKRTKETDRVSCGDGKYTVVFYDDGFATALRYGEPWPAYRGDGCNNLEQALARDLIAERVRVADLEEQLAQYKRYGKKSK